MQFAILSLIAVFLAHCGCGWGSLLPFAARQVDVPRDLTGTYTARLRGGQCPATITFKNAAGSSISHEDMAINGMDCTSTGTLSLGAADNDKVRDVILDQFADDAIAFNRIRTLLVTAADAEGALVGVETEDRVCGDVTLPARTFVLFLKQNTSVNIFDVPELPPLMPGLRWMLSQSPEQSFLCIFNAPLKQSASPSPSVSPSPSRAVALLPGATVSPSETTSISPSPDDNGNLNSSPEFSVAPSPDEGLEFSPAASDVVNASQSSATDKEDDGSVCFPADATVELEDGSIVTMKDIKLGNKIKIGPFMYSDVYMFTHKLSDVDHPFIKIATHSGDSISLTSGHYLVVNNIYAAARSVKVGDSLELGDGTPTTVSSVSIVHTTGLYNPQTVHGEIIVNNIRASTYTRAVEPVFAHTLLTPMRAMYRAFSWTFSILDSGADVVAPVALKGPVYY